jgi:uncharacterized cupredoxin-like copper-binding protein
MRRAMISLRNIGRATGLFVMASVLIAGAAACGGDDDGDDNDGPTATAGTPAATDGAATPGATDGGPTGTGASVTQMAASLTNSPFAVTLSQETVPAGSVNIQVTNDGTVGHNFWVVRTELARDALPLNQNVVDVESLEVVTNSDLVTNEENLEPGTRLQVLTTLEAGSYVLFCNVPDHYTSGMNAALTAE